MTFTGGCLCSAVRYEGENPQGDGHCHCIDCRKTSGMPGLVFVRASSLDDLEVFHPQMVVYTKRAPSWDRLDPELPSFEAMPPPEAMRDMGV